MFLHEYLLSSDNVKKCVERNAAMFRLLDGKTILISGGSGLIGSYFIVMVGYYNCRYQGNVRVINVDIKETPAFLTLPFFDFVDNVVEKVENLSLSFFKNKKIDFIIHAASHTSPYDYANDPVGTMLGNFFGTKILLDLAENQPNSRFLFCSSVEAYGAANSEDTVFVENYSGYVNANTTRSAYPSAKRASESLCAAYRAQHGVDYCIARIGRIIGPTVDTNDTKAPTQFILNAAKEEDVVLKSDGMQFYTYGYVTDCVTAILYILTKGVSGEAYNVASEHGDYHLREIAEMCSRNSQGNVCSNISKSLDSQGYSKITRAVLDMSKLKKMGWQSVIDIPDGIKETVSVVRMRLEGKLQ